MDNTNAFRDYLSGLSKAEVQTTLDNSPDRVEFRIKHSHVDGITHKALMVELMNHDLWLVSATPTGSGNDRQKTFAVVGGASPSRPDPL